jgi:ABC-2 type transport system permease protein/lipopolysaccharide transport system permease protein
VSEPTGPAVSEPTTPDAAAADAAGPAWKGPDAPLFEALRDSIRNPAFWGYSTWLDIVIRYRRSVFGLAWIAFPPALYIFGMGAFFASLQGRHPLEFMPHIGVGYLLFRMFTMVLIDSTSVLPAHSGYILDGRVRITDFVLRVNFKALFYLAVGFLVLFPVMLFAPNVHWPGLLGSVLGLALLIVNLLWMSGVVSLFGARYPDTHEFMGNVFVLGFLLTPILWYPADAPAGTWQGLFMRLNPMYHLIEVVRAPVLGEALGTSSIAYCIVLALLGWGLWAWSYRRYARYVALWV